ncbi:cyclin-dependent protein kinase inhibitor SMR1 [Cajanus cajan]|uniref:Cyclin-dependent protein kinase inhibitor SMR1 n=1 Tax=Cajanus cajan TaxID=3821 RepID=A0A151T0T2_CAJCA|nr:cyclin-dependent protein kinase inhibitor SMR1 [Cajanus cajan]KYP60663.1 hypothetical protein KK1_023070 [Cajanus cajan]
MSTDLHLHHELPKLRIAAVKLEDAPSSPRREVSSVVDTPPEDQNHVAAGATAGAASATAGTEEDESYRTPTSKESRIPAIMTCPPAPKKAKPFISCKRKLLDEFQFFEVSNEDMDAFFRSTFPKRSCPCT